ncbi:MAG: hypothetical protein ISS71_03380 [Phycisphaerae bacterium]|nr:hypothetical protein [Phycisphaerae bacterium]
MKKIQFHNLISLAQQETPPRVDVADSVLATLSGVAQQVAAEPYRAYLWTGIVSAAVAACIVIATAVTLQGGSDSVSEMMSYVSWVTQ